MINIARSIRSAVMRRFAAREARQRRRDRAERRRLAQRLPHEVLYFHQPDDPYSLLAAQALPGLLERYNIRLVPKVVAAPTPIAIHEQQLWDNWALRDCAMLAPRYGLQFQPCTRPPDATLLAAARRLALSAADGPALTRASARIGHALAAGNADDLGDAGAARPSEAEIQQRLDENFRLRHRLGHYLGGMFHYAGEWYWGIDRLHYLEARLDALGARRAQAPAGPTLQRLPLAAPPPPIPGRRLQLEYFPSLRSPYTHLSYDRVAELVRGYPVDLVLRPVLPMMMRGVKADRRKGQYILQDTAREADTLGIPFGNIWDPFGAPILRAYSLFPWARERGRGFEYLHQYSLAVWSERVDAYGHAGLRRIVERAGLDWSEALKHLDNRDWEAEFEGNVQAMIAAGSWGVPTLRLPAAGGHADCTVWGQDRIWVIEEEIQRRLGKPAAA